MGKKNKTKGVKLNPWKSWQHIWSSAVFIFLIPHDIVSVIVTGSKSGQGLNFYGERETNTDKPNLGK